MEIFVGLVQIGIFVFLLGIILWWIFSDKEKHKYHKIDFKKKKEYLCVYYLFGKEGVKSNRGVLSKEGKTYLLEIEDEVTVYKYSFESNKIKQIEIQEKTGIRMEDAIVGHEIDHTKAYFSGGMSATTFEYGKRMKIKKYYEIKITFIDGTTLNMESIKNPTYFFENQQ